jgi:hypothetical protein
VPNPGRDKKEKNRHQPPDYQRLNFLRLPGVCGKDFFV